MSLKSEQILAAIARLDEADARLAEVIEMDHSVTGTARSSLSSAQARLRQARAALTDKLGAAVARERLSC